jgi:hypothetical protein
MVRSSNPKTIFRDITKTLERTVTKDFEKINKLVADATPRDTGYASKQWRQIGKYKLGDTKSMIVNTAPYIGLLDSKGHTSQYKPVSSDIPTGYSYVSRSQPYASSGIVPPVLQSILTSNKKI